MNYPIPSLHLFGICLNLTLMRPNSRSDLIKKRSCCHQIIIKFEPLKIREYIGARSFKKKNENGLNQGRQMMQVGLSLNLAICWVCLLCCSSWFPLSWFLFWSWTASCGCWFPGGGGIFGAFCSSPL